MRLNMLPARPAPWDDLNRQALRAASDPDRAAEMASLLKQLADRWPDHLSDMALGWIDAMAQALGTNGYGPDLDVNCAVDYTTVESMFHPREISDAERWAFQVITARMKLNHTAYLHLFSNAWSDGVLARNLHALLRIVGYNLARAKRGES